MSMCGARSLLRSIQLNVLECKVCFEQYGDGAERRPCVLPCGHAVCRQCARALARGRELQCPFCRRCGSPSLAADCLPLLQLAELLGSQPEAGGSDPCSLSQPRLTAVLGGWGQLLNPRALAVCPNSRVLAVADDGERRVRLWEPGGRSLEPEVTGLVYPLGVALACGGRLLVVTDGGDSSLKVFALGTPSPVEVRGGFGLPWGVAAVPGADQVVLSDAGRGSLLLLNLRLPDGTLLGTESVCEGLRCPREVAVCPRDGYIHVLEHLLPPGAAAASVRLKTFNSRRQLVRQIDSSGFSPDTRIPAGVSAIAVDGEGNMLVADGLGGTVGRVGGPGAQRYSVLIDRVLVRPSGLACAADGALIVLDSGDHTLKVFTAPYLPKSPAGELP